MHRLSAGVAALAAPLALLAAGPASAAEPTMPLTDVRPGMQCTALSVVQGTAPVTFNASVIGVFGGPRPADALIIMRFSGAAIDGTGIGQGFSGSPVSCPDPSGTMRVVGAISQGIGQYDNLVAGVTPIEAMLGTPTASTGSAVPTIGEPSSLTQTPTASRVSGKAGSKRRPKPTSGSSAPWGTGPAPLVLGGLRGPLATRLAAAATERGRPMSVGSTASRLQTPGGRLAAGDAVAVSAVTGDLSLAAIGTVTYTDGDRVWAFGHPFNGGGPSRMLLQQASIMTIIGSPAVGPQVTYKLGVPGAPVGTVAFDGSFAVGGLLGALPPTIPTDVVVRNASGQVVQTAESQVVDERAVRGGTTGELLPLAAGANAAVAMQRLTSQPVIGGAARACITIQLRGEKVPLYQCADTIVPAPSASTGGIESGIAEAVAGAVGPAVSAERFLRLVQRVRVDVTLRDEADTAQIVRIRRPARVRAGREATLRVVVIQGSSGERREIPVKVRIPRDAAGIRTGIVVMADAVRGPSDDEDMFFGDGEVQPPKNLPALRARYTGSGVSGFRALVVPAIPGPQLLPALSGEDSELRGEELEQLIKRVRVVRELPTVRLSGSATITVTPTR